MRPSMSQADTLRMEAEIEQCVSDNTEALGGAVADLGQRGLWVRARHAETGQIAPVFGIGFDEAHTYQVRVPGSSDSWDLISGDQLYL